MPAISATGLTKVFRTYKKQPGLRGAVRGLFRREHVELRAADDVTFSIEEGEFVGFLGPNGSGKTTTLNALSSFIDNTERVLTIEDTAELQLQQIHVGRMESRPANVEGKGAVTQRDCLRNALRMRPDRIIVGETRGEEVIDMLQAMNTGHDGSLSTCHANGPLDALLRLESLVLQAAPQWPLAAVRQQLARSIDIIVHVERGFDGKRRVSQIAHVVGPGEVKALTATTW